MGKRHSSAPIDPGLGVRSSAACVRTALSSGFDVKNLTRQLPSLLRSSLWQGQRGPELPCALFSLAGASRTSSEYRKIIRVGRWGNGIALRRSPQPHPLMIGALVRVAVVSFPRQPTTAARGARAGRLAPDAERALQANPQASTFGMTLVATATPRRYSCVWPALGGLFAHLELLGVPPMTKNQTPRRRKRRPIPVSRRPDGALLRQAQSLGFRAGTPCH